MRNEETANRKEETANRKERACGGCRERVSFYWHGEEMMSCGVKSQQYGRRCEHFRKIAIKEID